MVCGQQKSQSGSTIKSLTVSVFFRHSMLYLLHHLIYHSMVAIIRSLFRSESFVILSNYTEDKCAMKF